MLEPLNRQFIAQVHFNKAFIGIEGWCPETGFTGRDMMRSDVFSAVLDKGHETIIVTDSTKFGLKYPYTLGPTELISRVVTDDGLDTDIRAALKRHSLKLDIAVCCT